MLMARIYQPHGAGPFPTLLDLLVVAIDMTLAPEAPHPASVQDASYGVHGNPPS